MTTGMQGQATMRAALIERFGGPEVLRVADVPVPAPGPGQVLVDVAGSSVNPVDVAVRGGWMADYLPLRPPLTLGTDIVGTVAEIGQGVTDLAVGQPVYGVAGVVMGGSGGFAEQAVTAPALLAGPPAEVDQLAAGTLPLAGVSALQAVTERLRVEPGARVLVHGAAGGVGLIAVALAKHCGGQVVATVHRCRTAALDGSGANEVIDTDTTDLATVQPFDLVLDLVGTDPLLPVQVTRSGGRVVGLRTAPDQQAAAARGIQADLQATEVTRERLTRLADLVNRGVLAPVAGAVFDFAEIARAITVKEVGGVRGKIAIRVR